MMSVDVRREQRHIWNEYSRFYRTIGEEIVWFKFDTDGSQWDNVYDEGGKSYQPGVRIPALWVDQIEDPEQYSGEGRRPTQRLRFAVSASTLAMRGIGVDEAHGSSLGHVRPSAPVPEQIGRPYSAWWDDRLNDVVFYDNRFYAISQYQIRGRLQTEDVVIGIAAIELVIEDESDFDFFPYDNKIVDVADDKSAAEYLAIWVNNTGPGGDTVTLEFDLTDAPVPTLEGEWTALATNGNGTTEIPLTVNGSDIVLDLTGFTTEFPYEWELYQRTDTEQRLTVYRGPMYEVVLQTDPDNDNPDWLDLYISPDGLDDTVILEFRDPDTNELLNLNGEWDAYIELPTGTWGIPLDASDQDNGIITLDFTEFRDKLPANWWLIQTAPTGQTFKVYEGTVFILEV